VVTRPASSLAQDRESSPAETSVLTIATPPCECDSVNLLRAARVCYHGVLNSRNITPRKTTFSDASQQVTLCTIQAHERGLSYNRCHLAWVHSMLPGGSSAVYMDCLFYDPLSSEQQTVFYIELWYTECCLHRYNGTQNVSSKVLDASV